MSAKQTLYDMDCFEKIFREYYPGLLLFTERQVGDRDLAKDIVQDVFYRLYENVPSLSGDFKLKSWLYTASRNAAIDYLRHLKVIDNNKLLMAESMMYAAEVDEEIDEELAGHIRNAILSLPEQCRMIIHMSVIEGKKYTAIAEELNISINTVRTQISRGYKKLRQQLAGHVDGLVLFFYFRIAEYIRQKLS